MQQFRVCFYPRSTSNSDGSHTVLIRLHLNGKRMFLTSTEITVNARDWDNNLERVRLKTTEGRMINNKIENYNAEIMHIYYQYEHDPMLSLDLIKRHYTGNIAKTNENESFMKFFLKSLENRKEDVGKTISSSCYYKYSLTYRHFEDYLKNKLKRKDISFRELDYNIVIGFERFMRSTLADCCNNTIVRKMRTLKTIMIDARKRGLLTNDPFVSYKAHFTPTNRGYLEDSEVQLLIDHKFHCKRLEQIRDFFVFSCFTGLAYADMKNLKKKDIVERDDKVWIIKTREKTDILFNILLTPIALNILNKYNGQCKDGIHIFPIPSNQKYNSYMKEIADFCGIEKRLSSHLARHTFATMALNKGVPIESVSHMLGHTSIRTTQIYAKITTKKIESDMNEFIAKIGNFGSAPMAADLTSNPHIDAMAIDAKYPIQQEKENFVLPKKRGRGRPRKNQ